MDHLPAVAGDRTVAGWQVRSRPLLGGHRWLALVALLLLVAASCSTPDATATSDGEASPSDDVDSRLQACIEAAGYDWERVWPVLSSSEPPPEGSLAADPEFHEAFEGCVAELGLWEEGPFDATRIDEENRTVRAYVACMRDRGWSIADPEPWEGPEHPGLLEPPQLDVPENTQEADRLFEDAADCGIPVHDHDDGDTRP